MKTIILGVGLVGKAIALDLAADKQFSVSAVDLRKEPLEELREKGITSVWQQDLASLEGIKKILKPYDLVINAVPGALGFPILKTCLEESKNVVDITFSAESPLELDSLAREMNVTAIVDCGLAPGLSNILAGYASTKMDTPESLTVYVGGLPVVRSWPFEYKTVFSPADVIEEYLRPARYRENGQLIVRPALSDPELIEFEGLGTLEAFNTDGLRTLLTTLPFPSMKEMTLRYPGHREKMAILKAAGFFDSEPVTVDGQKIVPRALTTELLFSRLKLRQGEEDLAILMVVASGRRKGQPVLISFELLDRFDRASGIHSMARTTGYTATMTARALAEGLIKKTGIVPPEFLGMDEDCLRYILNGLKERGIKIKGPVDYNFIRRK
ncbi:MAG: saccharopine dehydrogenase family protein [Candidatus Aminicenantales bacterium]